MNRLAASLLVLAGGACYGLLSTFVKLGYRDGFSTAELTGSQVLFGCLGLWLLSLTRLSKIKTASFKVAVKLMASGMFTGLTGIFYYLSLKTLSASFAVILLFQFTWMGMLADWIYQRKKLTRNQGIALIFIVLGTVLAAGFEQHETFANLGWIGILFGLLAAACYTHFIYFSGQVATHVPALIRSTWMITGALVVTFIVFPPQFIVNGAVKEGLWKWGILLGFFGMFLPSYLYAKGTPHIETVLSTILGSVELPVVIIFSAVLLGDRTNMFQWIGIAAILFGIIVSERGLKWIFRRRKPESRE